MSNQKPIKVADVPSELVVPLRQSMGATAQAVVSVGDYVFKGQLIAQQVGKISANVHAPSSGTVTEISEKLIPHASGLAGLCIVIKCDSKDDWGDQKLKPISDIENTAVEELLERIEQCGIVGLGGATFPTSMKVDRSERPDLDTLIINGAECEPYISCDDRLMRERAVELIQGINILQRMLKPHKCLIGIEDNKPEAITALEAVCADSDNVEVVAIPTKYPSGGEKQLIEILTGLEVPANGRPRDFGLLCLNTGTIYSIYNAVINGEPLISRIITVTGNGVKHPQNFEVLIGTSFKHLAEQAGGYTANADHLIMGGPMMGFALEDDIAPIVKATNCALFISSEELNESNSEYANQPTLPCIRCGKCMDVCPVYLLPQQMYWHIRAKDFEKAQEHNLRDCIECGCCSYVCPSHIPLVDYYRFAKTEIREQALATEKSNIARERFEFLQYRRERDKQEREEKRAAHKAALQEKKAAAKANSQGIPAVDPKVAAIKAAMARAKAKKLEREKIDKDAQNASVNNDKKV
ncbi:UNVERIFIED_CONTAM: hypothetical protein GTU68_019498 [Idotea baltica]|nr:hypothetical protein [Idotea baltica]